MNYYYSAQCSSASGRDGSMQTSRTAEPDNPLPLQPFTLKKVFCHKWESSFRDSASSALVLSPPSDSDRCLKVLYRVQGANPSPTDHRPNADPTLDRFAIFFIPQPQSIQPIDSHVNVNACWHCTRKRIFFEPRPLPRRKNRTNFLVRFYFPPQKHHTKRAKGP
jgi:hypothetical protein